MTSNSTILLILLIYSVLIEYGFSQTHLACEIPDSYQDYTVVSFEGEKSFLIGDTLIPICVYDFEKGEVVFNDFKKLESRTRKKPEAIQTRNLIEGNVEVTNYEQDSLWRDYYYMDRRWEQLDIPVYIDTETFNEVQLRDVYWSLKMVENSSLIRFVHIPKDQFCQSSVDPDEPCEYEGNGKKIWYRKINTTTPASERDYFIYIYFADGGPCSAVVGRQINTNFQASGMRMTNGCSSTGYLHELLHVLGRVHEQSRYDRDRFIMMDWDASIHTTTAGQFRRNNLPRAYLQHFGLVSGLVGENGEYPYMDKDLQGTSHLVSINDDKTLMDFSELYKYDPYYLWGSYFSFNSVMLYNSGYTPHDPDIIPSRQMPYLQYARDLGLTWEEKANARSMEPGDADRINFLFKYDHLKESLFDRLDYFEKDDSLPIPAYVRFDYSQAKGFIGLPIDLEDIDNLGLYIVYRRGTFAERNLNPMYGGPQFIPLDYLKEVENLKDREFSFDISRLLKSVEVEDNPSVNGFDSKNFILQIGFYRVEDDTSNINTINYSIHRYIGPETEIQLTKIGPSSFREDNHPLRELKTVVKLMNLYPNPVKDGYFNVGLSYFSDNSPVENYTYEYQILDAAGRVLRYSSGVQIGGDLKIEGLDLPPGMYFFRLISKGEKTSQYTSNAATFMVDH